MTTPLGQALTKSKQRSVKSRLGALTSQSDMERFAPAPEVRQPEQPQTLDSVMSDFYNTMENGGKPPQPAPTPQSSRLPEQAQMSMAGENMTPQEPQLSPSEKFRNLRKEAKQYAAERQQGNWVNDAEIDSFGGRTLQVANRVANSFPALAARVASMPSNDEAQRLMQSIDDDGRELLNKKLSGEELTAEEQKRLDEPSIDVSRQSPLNSRNSLYPSSNPFNPATQDYDYTNKKSLNEVYDIIKDRSDTAKSINETLNGDDTFLNRGFNTRKRDDFNRKVGYIWEDNKDRLNFDKDLTDIDNARVVADMIAQGGGEIVDNPQAMFEYFGEQAADIAASGSPLGASFMAISTYNDILGKDLQGNLEKGELNSVEKSRERVGEAALGAVLDVAGDAVVGQVSGLGRIGKRAASKRNARDQGKADAQAEFNKKYKEGDATNAEEIKPAAKPKANAASENKKEGSVIGDALTKLGKGATKKAGKVAGSAGSELVAEGVQTNIEDDTFGDDFDLERDGQKTLTSGLVGAGIGSTPAAAGMVASGTASALSQSTKSIRSQAKKKQSRKLAADKVKADAQKAVDEELDAAIAGDNFDDIVEKSTSTVESSENLDFSRVMRTIAARQKEATQKAKRTKSRIDIETADELTNAYATIADDIETRQEEVDAQIREHNANPENSELTEDEVSELKKKSVVLGEKIEIAGEYLDQATANNRQVEKVSAAVNKVKQSETRDQEFEQNAQAIFEANAFDPDSITIEQMEQILTSDKWTDEERTRLERSVQSRRAIEQYEQSSTATSTGRTMSQVTQDIYKGRKKGADGKGDKGTMGIRSYRTRIGQALKKGDTDAARRHRDKLAAFTARQKQKAEAVADAFAPFARVGRETGYKVQMTDTERAAIQHVEQEFGLKIHGKSGSLVNNIQQDADALTEVLNEVDATMATSGATKSAPSRAQAAPTAPTKQSQPTQQNSAQEATTATESAPTEQTQQADTTEDLGGTITNDDPDVDGLPPELDTNTTEAAPNITEDAPNTAPDGEANPSTETDTDTTTQTDEAPVDNTIEEELNEVQTEINNKEAQLDEVRSNLNNKELLRARAYQRLGLNADDNPELNSKDSATFKEMYSAVRAAEVEKARVIREEIAQLRDDRELLQGRQINYDAMTEVFDNDTTNPLGLTDEDSARISQASGRPHKGVFSRLFKTSNKETVIRSIPNLLRQLMRAPTTILAFKPELGTLDMNQKAAVRHFAKFANRFGDVLNGTLPDFSKMNKDRFDARNHLYAAFIKDGKLLPAARDAMSAVAYNWLANDAKSTTFATKQTIGSFWGVDSDAVPANFAAQWSENGIPMNFIVRDMGKSVMRGMGIKIDPETATSYHLDQLALELGQITLNTMVRDGMVELSRYDYRGIGETGNSDIDAAAAQRLNKSDPNKPSYFYTVKVTNDPELGPFDEGKVTGPAAEIMSVNEDTDRITERLFDTATRGREPSFKPITSVPKKMKGTYKDIPEATQDMILKNQQEAMGISETVDDVFSMFDDEQQQIMMGVVPKEQYETMPINMRERVIAKNNGLLRELENFKTWRQKLTKRKKGLATPFYLGMEVWNYGRFGYTNSTINPQTSKIHRALTGPKAWKRTIKSDDMAQQRHFMLAVAQGLDIDIDKLTVDTAMEEVTAKLGLFPDFSIDPNHESDLMELVQDINTLRDLPADEIASASELRASIAERVSGMKEAPHALRALTAFADFVKARENADEDGNFEFSSDLWVELDGVTNGVVIGSIIFGNGNVNEMKNMLKPGGQYFANERSMGENKEAGELDYYEQQAQIWSQFLNDKMADRKTNRAEFDRLNAAARILFGFDISKDNAVTIARKMAKEPLMQNVYGAGAGSLSEKLTQAILERVDDLVDATINHPTATDAAKIKRIQQIENSLKTLSGRGKPVFDLDGKAPTVANYREAPFDKSAMYAISRNVKREFAKPMIEAVESKFGTFKENRSIYTDNMANLNTAFVKLLKVKLNKRKQQLVEAGTISKEDKLPKAYFDEVVSGMHAIMPSVGYAQSTSSSNNLQAAKLKKQGNADEIKASTFNPGTPVLAYNIDGTVAKGEVKSFGTIINEEAFADEIGVGPGVQNIHSNDASEAFEALYNHVVINVHDGFPVAFDDYQNVGKTLNEAFLNVYDVNPYQNVLDQIKNVQKTVKSMVKSGEMTKAEGDKVIADLIEGQTKNFKGEPKRDFADFKYLQTEAGVRADVNKELKDSLEYSVQYNLEGAGHETPKGKENREKREKTGKPLSTDPKPTNFGGPADDPKSSESQTSTKQTQQELTEKNIKADFSKGNQLKASGELDTNSFGHHFEKAMAEEPNISRAIGRAIKESGTKGYEVGLLRQLVENLPEGLTIKIVKPTDDVDTIGSVMRVRGMQDPNTDTITLKGNEFRYDGVNPETLAHEILHAMSAKVIDNVQNGVPVSPTAKKAVEKMEQLLDEVKAEASAKGIPLNKNGLANVKEFLAWGMTNRQFIAGLKNINVKRRQNKGLINAFTEFANTLTKFFGKGKQLPATNALKQLIELSSAIIEEDAKVHPRAPKYSETNAQRIEALSPEELIEELAKRNSEQDADHINHLVQVQRGVVNAFAGPNGVELQQAEAGIGDELDQYLNHLANDTKPFVSTIRNVFNLSDAETYAAEQLEAALGSRILDPGFVKNEMVRSWESAKAALKWEDFLPHPSYVNVPAEVEAAKAKHEYLFRVGSMNNGNYEYSNIAGKYVDNRTSDFMTRFTVAASVSKEVRDALANAERQMNTESTGSMLTRITNGLGSMLNRADEVVNGSRTPSHKVIKAQDELLQHMATHNFRNKRKLGNIEQLEQNVRDKANAKISETIRSVADSSAIHRGIDSENAFISAVASSIYLVGGDRVGEFMDMIGKIRKKSKDKVPGEISGILNEIRGATSNNEKLLQALRFTNRDVEQERRFAKETMKGLVRQATRKPMTETEHKSVHKALLQTDAAPLLEAGYTLSHIEQYLSDPAALSQEISRLENTLGELDHDEKYIAHSRATGYFMATGNATTRLLHKNAGNIARLFGYNLNISESAAQKAEPIIDILTSLNAMQYTAQGHRELAAEVLRSEAARQDGENGIEFILKQSNALRKEALVQNFDGETTQMAKGYTPEITNPHITLAWAPANSQKEKELREKGYRMVQRVERDGKLDQSSGMNLYAIEDGGMTRRVTGVASYTAGAAKGTDFMETAELAGQPIAYRDRKKVLGGMTGTARKDATSMMTANFDPAAVEATEGPMMIPTFHNDGQIKDFRYEMSEDLREKVLQKQHNVGEALGTMSGNIIDKANTRERNRDLIDILHRQFIDDASSEDGDYLVVGPSAKGELKEFWDLLPHDAKEYAREKFGAGGIRIKHDVLRLAFGFRKPSLQDIWAKDPQSLNMVQKTIRTVVDSMFGKRLDAGVGNAMRKGERFTEEVVKMVKDNFVVKNLFTTIGNIISNFALLAASDVPIRQAASGTIRGWREAGRYNTLRKKQYEVERKLAVTVPGTAAYRNLISESNQYKTQMTSSPVHDLMQAGMFQTIVDDIDTAQDPYSFRSKFTRKMEDTLQNKRMGPLNQVGKFLFVTQDTKLYQWMNQPIQLSDFAARFAQYEYMTQQAPKKLSKQDALDKVSANFINYDVPTTPGLQWANDMGLAMFTKYALRIQRPIFDLFMEKPASALMTMMTTSSFGIASPFEAFLQNPLDKLANPISSTLDAWDEPLPLNGMLHAIS